MKRAGEAGYALVAAVASIAAFAGIALILQTSTGSSIATARAELARARAQAAADAGIAMAIQQLLSTDPSSRWGLDDRTRRLDFDNARVAIRIEDERGKVPINLIEEEQVRVLLAGVGLHDEALDIATDSLLDWRDDDDDQRPNGAEAGYYRVHGVAARNGPLLSVEELADVRGFDRETIARLKPLVTVNFGSGPFNAAHALPLAIRVMTLGQDPVSEIEREREIAGQRTALEAGAGESIVGVPITILSDVTLPDGSHARRSALIELTGAAERPYVVRVYE